MKPLGHPKPEQSKLKAERAHGGSPFIHDCDEEERWPIDVVASAVKLASRKICWNEIASKLDAMDKISFIIDLR